MPKILTPKEIDQKVEEYRAKLMNDNQPIHLEDEDKILVSIKYLDRDENIIKLVRYYVDSIWSDTDALTNFFQRMNESKKKFVLISYSLRKVNKMDLTIDFFVKPKDYSCQPDIIDLRTKDDEDEETEEDDEDEN